MKDELGGKIMKEFFRLKAKTYSYLKDNNGEDKKSKRNKKVCHKKRNLNFKITKTGQKQVILKIKKNIQKKIELMQKSYRRSKSDH